jgi:hypothetical protein
MYHDQSFALYSCAIKYSRIFDKCPVLCCPVGMKLSAYAKQHGIS